MSFVSSLVEMISRHQCCCIVCVAAVRLLTSPHGLTQLHNSSRDACEASANRRLSGQHMDGLLARQRQLEMAAEAEKKRLEKVRYSAYREATATQEEKICNVQYARTHTTLLKGRP